MNKPETVDIESSLLWGENILEKAGISTMDNYMAVKVEGQIITLENTSNGEMIEIKYEFDSSGEISFSVN